MNVNLREPVTLSPTNIVAPFQNRLGIREEPRLTAGQLTEGDIGLTAAADLPPSMRGGAENALWTPTSTKPDMLGDRGQSLDFMLPPVVPTGDGDGNGGDTTNAPVVTAPVVPATGTGVTPSTDFAAAKAAAIAAAGAKAPFEHYYVGGAPTAEQTAFMQAHRAAPSMVGLEQYAADGGRMGYAGGGISAAAVNPISPSVSCPAVSLGSV